MGRAPCCDKATVKRGQWSPQEDTLLRNYIQTHGTGGNWIALPRKAGLNRCGKSCRLRWLNYLRPDIKHGGFTQEEDFIICSLYNTIGSRWSVIASKLPGRTDNDVKNYWNTRLKKKISATGQFTTTYISTETSSVATTSSASTIEVEANDNSWVVDDENTNFTALANHMNCLRNLGEEKGDTWGKDPVQVPLPELDETWNMISERETFDAETSSHNLRLPSDSMGSSDDDEFWMKMFSSQLLVTGPQLEEKVREIASLLDIKESPSLPPYDMTANSTSNSVTANLQSSQHKPCKKYN
ncbi:hypothetical protein Ancab_016911 [Ancistrocladus abbreviatus]